MDEDWRDDMSQAGSYSSHSADDEERRQFFFDSLVSQETLQQNLLEQLNLTDISPSDRKIAELIIGNIDDSGFLQTPPEEMAANTGIDAEDLSRVLELIQSFEPVGVGARNLQESLQIQLRRKGKADSLEYRIVTEFLDELGRKRFPEIAKKLGVTPSQIQECANRIATLEPRPGQVFTPAPSNYVIPDVTVELVDGEYQVSLNGDQIPHLRISNAYKDLMASEGRTSEIKDYIRDKIRSGKFLIKSIHQRQETIANIANEIVLRQRDFLDHGVNHLKPLTMVQIAEVVGVHETTVSRAISGKYIATPQGTFELRYFFTSGYQTAEGVQLSNTSVKETIAELIRNESSTHPLSDKEIVDILEKQGIPIARRTVAKYRTELSILPSNMRKRY